MNQLLENALMHHQAGRMRESETLYKQILLNNPSHFDALHMLGVLSCQTKKNETGIDLIRKAIAINPDVPVCHNNLGKALKDSGKLEEAISCFKVAIELKPDFALAYNNLADTLNQMGKPETATDYCKKAISLKPDFAEAHYNLGIALKNRGKHQAALDCFHKSLSLKPDFTQAHNHLGLLYTDLEKIDKAIAHYNKAIELKSDFIEAYNNLGIVLKNIGKISEAIDCYKKAISLNPEFAAVYNNLGLLHNDTGNKEKAITCYKKAIELKPDFAEAFGNLAYLFEQTNHLKEAAETAAKALQHNPKNTLCNFVAARCERRQNNFSHALSRLEKIHGQPLFSTVNINILYEKGMLHDRLGTYDKAFECFSNANMYKSKTWIAKQINKKTYIQKISKLKSFLSNHQATSWNSSEHNSREIHPVFIVGFPRSGTTLLEQILGAKKNIQTLEEKPLVQTAIQRLNNQRWKYPDDLSQIDFKVIDDLREKYFAKASEYLTYKPNTMLIDKLPLNIADIALIHRIFPKSKIILALRHPADVCLSCFIQNFELNEAMVHFLDIKDTAKLYNLVMELWNIYINVFPLKFHIVKYEDLVTDFDKETKKLFAFLNITWEPSVRDYLSYTKSRKKIFTPSYHQVSEPIYKRSIFRWKNYSKDLQPIFDILKPHINRFKYSLNENTVMRDTK